MSDDAGQDRQAGARAASVAGWGEEGAGGGLTLALRSSCWNSGCGKRPWFFTKAGTSGGRWLS